MLLFKPTSPPLLRSRPCGTTADLNDDVVVFWDGTWAKGARVKDGMAQEKFDLDERACNRLHGELVAWLAAPRYSVHPEVEQWL